jgi:hypothetical protein
MASLKYGKTISEELSAVKVLIFTEYAKSLRTTGTPKDKCLKHLDELIDYKKELMMWMEK